MGAFQNVFGHDVQFDAEGKPIETGIGALKRVAAEVGADIAEVVDPSVFKELEAAKEEIRQLNADLAAVHAERDALAAQVVAMTDQLKALARVDPVAAETAQL